MGKKVTADFRVRKRAKKKQQPEDRISQLPNEILVNILSFLTHEDAARTSVLSKRWIGLWMGLWMCAAGLNFESAKMWEGIKERRKEVPKCLRLLGGKRQKYVKWVNKVLQSHKANVLDVFRIRFDLDETSKNDIDKWLHYAFARRVHSLELNLLPYGTHLNCYKRMSYDFPHDLLGLSDGNSSAVSPSDSCRNGINSDAFFGFKSSLRSLKFDNVKVSGSVLQFFLRNCPFLEHLVVGNSVSLKQLEVCGPSLALKHLEIKFCPNLLFLSACDTNIVSLKVTHGQRLVLKNVPKLVDVDVGGHTNEELVGLVDSAISWLSCCLSKLEFLTLHVNDVQLTWELDANVALPQLTTLKQLTIFLCAPDDYSLMPFTSLIRASPNLENFLLKTDRKRELGTVRLCKKPRSAYVAFSPQRLKVVELHGYYGHKSEVELVKYLLDNAVALERIVIDPRDQPLDGPGPDSKPREEARFRNLAKQQLQEIVPPHVYLLLL